VIGVTLEEFAYQLSIWALPVLFAVGCHEAAHGWAASKLGDDTAQRLGRVTLNPLRHIDPMGTMLLPVLLLVLGSPFLFGYARPVPVAFRRLRPARLGMILVAAAGPAANLALCVISLVLIQASAWVPDPFGGDWLTATAQKSVMLNAILAVFNLLPVPPLDGGRIVAALLPAPLARRFTALERGGIAIVLVTLFLLPWVLGSMNIGFNPISWLIITPVQWLINGLIAVV